MKQLPNILTLSRMALLPLLIWLLYVPQIWAMWAALGLYAFSAITDFLDGYLARKMNIVSPFGPFLDPIADKVFVAVILIALVDIGRLDGLWTIPVIIIFMREFLVSGMREFLGPKNIKLPVTQLAKWKTTFQMVSLGILIYGGDALVGGQWTLAIAAILTVITGWSYLRVGLKHLND
jgi:cardiolipin synthase